jgi:hypothetical protein
MNKTILVIIMLILPVGLFAATTTGGVNWLDPLGYTKPAFYPVTIPNTPANVYYVSMQGGSGSTCSQGSPCAWAGVNGKAGTQGGPAYIYLKGPTGTSTSWGMPTTLYGSAGNEIVIMPWPGDSTVWSFRPMWIEGTSYHNIIIDGGPNLQFKALPLTGYGEGNSNGININLNSNYITFARIQGDARQGNGVVGVARNYGVVTGTKFINCEFYDTTDPPLSGSPLMYPGGGNNCEGQASTVNDFSLINSILRDAGPEGIEINPRTNAIGGLITGNAFHNVGKESCNVDWNCRPPIILTMACTTGIVSGYTVSNNIMWDTGAGCIHMDTPGGAHLIYNNTCWNYSVNASARLNRPAAINSYSNYSNVATVRDNILIYSPQNGAAFANSNGYTISNNECLTGVSCGTSAQTDSVVNTFISTDPNSADFLKIKSSAKAVNNGYATGVATDYLGYTRNVGALDIGAFEYGATGGEAAPAIPTAVGVTLSGGTLQ